MLLNPSNELSPCAGQHPASTMFLGDETSELKLFYHSLRYRTVQPVSDDDKGIYLGLGEIFGHVGNVVINVKGARE